MSIIDSIIDKVVQAVIEDNQVFKLPDGKGRFMMVKDKPEKPSPYIKDLASSLLLTDGWRFFLYWFKRRDEAPKFGNRGIYVVKTSKKTKLRIRDHVLDLAMDPYKRDYNTILKP